jgi:protein-tyrosine phosphatase
MVRSLSGFPRTAAGLLAAALLWLGGCAAPAAVDPSQGFRPPADIPGVGNFGVVAEGLWRGARPTREGLRELQRRGVRAIVNLEGGHDDPVEFLDGGVKYYHIPSTAWNPEPEKIAAFLKIVTQEGNRPVFVHCRRGADRTGCAVATYRILMQGWTADRAERELRAYDWNPIYGRIPEFLRAIEPAAMWERVGRSQPEPRR